MALNDILGSALSGLAASQAGLRSVSNNIANVSTPGYARERVTLSTGVTGGRVNGVVVSEPARIADRFLEATVYRRSGDMGRADVAAAYLDRLQSLLGAPGAEGGLPTRLDQVTASAIAMTSSASSEQTVAAFTGNVQDALISMQQLDRDVSALRGDVETEVGFTIEKINGLLQRIHELNDTVARLDVLGRSSAGAGDQRMSAVQELSGLVNVTVREQPDGRVSIDTASGAALLDRRLRQLSYPTTGQGVSQSSYPSISLHFAEPDGSLGPATGERIDSAAAGGRLGGLLDLRDRALPEFSDKLGVLFGGLAETLNAVSNAGTTVPAPSRLDGRQTGLVGTDRLGFTGTAVFAVVKTNGELVAKTSVDFSALGPTATVDDAVAAVNAGLGGTATAAFVNGTLTLTATAAGQGVAVAQDPAVPSDRAGTGFSQYFGLNDLVRSADSALTPPGFVAGDPHGFGTGETTELILRDPSGRALVRYTLTPSTGGTMGDLLTDLNASPIADFGTFSIDDRGRFRFDADPGVNGASLSIPADSTDRFGTGRSFTALSGLTGTSTGLDAAEVRPVILGSASQLPLARLDTAAAVGAPAIGAGDIRGATDFVNRLSEAVDFGSDGEATIERFAGLVLGRAGMQASQAADRLADATARREDAVNRRDAYSGVNIDEELSQLVIFQNSYSAAARVMSTATEMYDTLIAMVG
ncbi:flagellar hook-associated protein FlgK [Sphingosinicella terrae]|uniref:flagellar hook-associated protein FlgK n=1 Tax=Sphingosinicella terrae TaxID=2172047 RepID=UPI000E0D2E16|nr:flagellar basal body rod C-terminal domain-containing protein [Sphingosinicella terrae]